MPRVVLTHTCNHPACSGRPGDELDLSDELAQYLLGRKGAKLVKPQRPRRPVPDEGGEEGSDDDSPGASSEETAAGGPPPDGPQESARDRRRRRRGKADEPKGAPDETTTDGDEADTETGDAAEAE